MHKGVIAYLVILAIIIIIGYYSTNGFRALIAPHASTATTTVAPNASASTTATSTVAPYINNCSVYTAYLTAPNSTTQSLCRWQGGKLGIWVASGLSSSVHFLIKGANNVTYVNSSANHQVYNCTTFYKNFTAPAQIYNITFSTGPPGGTCNSYSLLKLNRTTIPPVQVYKQVYNGNFSTGDFTGWNITDKGFANGPMNITYADSKLCYQGAPWANYNGTFFATTFNCGLTNAPGNLTSSPFIVTEPFLNFRIISPADQYIYLELLYNNTPVVIAHYNTYNLSAFNATSSYTFRNESMSLIGLAGKTVRLRVVADTLVQHNYIAIGDFMLQPKPSTTPGVTVNYTS